MSLRSLLRRVRLFFDELRRRRVTRVALAYAGVAFVVLGTVDLLLPVLALPDWTYPVLVLVAVLGFPVALFLSWAFDVTPEGIRAAEPYAAPGGAEEAGPEAGGPRPEERVGAGYGSFERPGPRKLVAGVLQALTVVALTGAAAWLVWRGGFAQGGPGDGQEAASAVSPNPAEVAVFYFDDHSQDGSLGHLADGLTEDLINELARVGAIEVRSRKAVEPYRSLEVSLDSAARSLGVGSVVEGSVARSGERVRVVVRLADPLRGTLIGSETLEMSWGDWFAMRDSTTAQVAFLLQRHLGREIRLRERRTGTDVDEAWVALQRGDRTWKSARALRVDGDLEAAARALARADSLLSRAGDLDPDWAEPPMLRGWVALTRLDVDQTAAVTSGETEGLESVGRLREGLEHAERALALRPGLPEALELRGTLRLHLWELPESSLDAPEKEALLERAEEDLRTAVQDHPWPARALATLSDLLRKKGSLAEAYEMAERAYDADPFLFLSEQDGRDVLLTVAQAALDAAETDAALRWCELGVERFPDDQVFVACALSVIAYAGTAEADASRAWDLARRWEELAPSYALPFTRAAASIQVASVLARAARPDSARAVLERALEEAPGNDPDLWYYEAAARLRLGDRDEAIRLLERYLRARPAWRDYIAADWFFSPLADDPRFEALTDGSGS